MNQHQTIMDANTIDQRPIPQTSTMTRGTHRQLRTRGERRTRRTQNIRYAPDTLQVISRNRDPSVTDFLSTPFSQWRTHPSLLGRPASGPPRRRTSRHQGGAHVRPPWPIRPSRPPPRLRGGRRRGAARSPIPRACFLLLLILRRRTFLRGNLFCRSLTRQIRYLLPV